MALREVMRPGQTVRNDQGRTEGTGDMLLHEAESFLTDRACGEALVAFDSAEAAGADADRCAGGRWVVHMLMGQYAEAWRESDAIRARGAEDQHRFWQGEPIDGKRVMLRCLHGYGDTVMYLRWLPELRARCSEVMVQVCPEMLPLVRAMVKPAPEMPDAAHGAPVRVIGWGAPGKSDGDLWDVQVESAELPYLFRATTAELPLPVRITFAEAEMHRVRTRMGERTRPRVGLVWTGSNYDAARSIPFAQFRSVLQDHAVEFWSLQAPGNNGAWSAFCEERGWKERTFYTQGCSSDAGELQHAGIADMAAFAGEMDAVLTIDTMAAHVAGSLGVPTWLLLKCEADWRWMLDREDSPWYPTMRLFRQRTAGDWAAPLQRVAQALRDLCEEQGA